MKHHLTFKDDKSDKFWNIEVDGTSFTVTYGKTGAAGQTQTKSFDDEETCLKEAEKLLNEKLKKGYVEGNATLANTKSATVKKNPEPSNEYLIEWEAIVDAKDIHKALIKHFSYLADNARFQTLLEVVFEKARSVSCNAEALKVTFPKFEMIATPPMRQIPENYPRSYQNLLKKHETIELSEFQYVLGEHGHFDREVQKIWFEDFRDLEEESDSLILEFAQTENLQCPVCDGVSGNFWIYHPNKKNSAGEPIIYYLESDGAEMIGDPQPCNAGSVFLKMLANSFDMQMAVKEILSGKKMTDSQAWWDNLDNGWKKFLTGSCYRKEDPAAEALALKSLGSNTDINIKTLEPLRPMKLLKRLSLFVPNINDISPLVTLKQLIELRIGSTKISDFSSIGKLVKLKELTLIFNESIELDLSWLKDLSKLNELTIYVEGHEKQIRIQSLHALQSLQSLKELELMNIRSTTGEKISLEPLSSLIQLEKLTLRDFPFQNLEPLYKLRSLKEIGLSSSVDTADIKNIMPWCKIY
ncbi:WGR domain-containing protein [Leptospira santarosai]|uniref:WGR domain-containing protein n=1 Tax=Leptospira santarosai TaxID=28183 RepID=UPI000248B013|nr:WGR domain-containing protein [Leptospira santarosai]